MAILRYVGQLGGLYPSDSLDAAKCDAVMDCATDFWQHAVPVYMEKNEAKKTEMSDDMASNFLPTWLANMEKQVSSTDGAFFAEKMGVSDIVIAYRLHLLKAGFLEGIPDSIADPYPSLNFMYDAVVGDPKIKAFLAQHAK
ncbi:unnamed protein product [Scytosiphon promiscuus]